MGLVGTSLDPAAIAKAEARAQALGIDLAALSARLREARPAAVNPQSLQQERRNFLLALHDGDAAPEAEARFERIIAGNELQPVNFLPRGALAAQAVLRVVIRTGTGQLAGYGTGFLIGDGVFLTNNHVLPDPATAGQSIVEAFYETDLHGHDRPVQRFALEPHRLFHTSKPLDFTIVAVAPRARGGEALAPLGWLPLVGSRGKALEGEWLTIVQHPMGQPKQLCIRENQLLKRDTDVLWYSTDTLSGSSGSPVFNNDWLVVALHHSGVPETRGGRWQTIDGRDFRPGVDDEDQIKWLANEGIRVSRIVETLGSDAAMARHPMVRPLLNYTPAAINATAPVMFAAPIPAPNPAPNPTPIPAPAIPRSTGETAMSPRLITVTLAIADDGSATIVNSAAEAATLERDGAARPPKRRKKIIRAPVVPEQDWITGYDPEFLGKGALAVPLPRVRNPGIIAPLIDAYGQKFSKAESAAGVLKYNGFSVVMHKERRLAIYSAANVDVAIRPETAEGENNWMFDDRIDRKYQIDNSLYRGNKLDRGHLTRREDMEYGPTLVDAIRRANGTCTWTNCVPQHEIFNQDKHPDKTIQLWHGLERHILEDGVKEDQFSVQVFTGPVFGLADPVYRGVAIPLDYWKVVAAIDRDGNLFATGYVLGQKAVLDQFGLEAARDVPFGAFGVYQRSIRSIENLTGLDFTFGNGRPLSEVDPLERASTRPRRRSRVVGANEIAGVAGDDRITDFDDILLY
ncbi:MAG: DNA/RNA non-specific endonuclease [Alphaproteobacteria bacterium]|nr:DNA/RNA non-specific endonuclease [Alphaproteobacteria bacterium]